MTSAARDLNGKVFNWSCTFLNEGLLLSEMKAKTMESATKRFKKEAPLMGEIKLYVTARAKRKITTVVAIMDLRPQ